MMTEPEKEHYWLQRLVGEWIFEGETTTQPGKPGEKFRGSERVQSVGGFWTQATARGEMPGCGMATTVMTLGFNPLTRRFVGTWIGSMMADLWLYDGELDAGERILTLNSEGPAMAAPDQMATYQDVITLVSDDHRTLASQVLGDDGKWHACMHVDYRRIP